MASVLLYLCECLFALNDQACSSSIIINLEYKLGIKVRIYTLVVKCL